MRDAFDLGGEFGSRRGRHGRCIGALDLVAQRVEFAVQAGGHLLAQFLAQTLEFAGDLADGGGAVLLDAHTVDVAGNRLVGLVGIRPRGAAAPAAAAQLGMEQRSAAARRSAVRNRDRRGARRVARARPHARSSAPSRDRSSLLSRFCRDCVICSRDGLGRRCLPALSVSRYVRLLFIETPIRLFSVAGQSASSPAGRCTRVPHWNRFHVRAVLRKVVNNSIQNNHDTPTCAHFAQRGKQGVNQP